MPTSSLLILFIISGGFKIEKKFSQDYVSNILMLDNELRLKDSFDLVGRDLKIDKHNAKLYFVDGFCKDEIMVKIMSYFLNAE